jgi:tetratricopeptide (TPR) repeat protein
MLNRNLLEASTSVRALLILILASLALSYSATVRAQVDTIDDSAADPMKLFERGQNAHSRGEFERALEYYDEAIKIKPEFAEAEFQRGNALSSLKRLPEAETAFRRAIQLRGSWSLPYVNLGILLVRLDRNSDAEKALRQALKIDDQNGLALRVLADVRLRAGDAKEALELSSKATTKEASPANWIVRAMAERKLGLLREAAASLGHVLEVEPNNVAALVERAELSIDASNFADAIKDLRAARQLAKGNQAIASRLAYALERNGEPDEARRVAEGAGILAAQEVGAGDSTVIGAKEDIEAANSSDAVVARKALLKLLEKNPRSATLLARLGASYRTENPVLSLDYFRRASEIKPDNAEYAVGYASALVQQRRFIGAISVLRRVLALYPDNYAAHSNLATALYAEKSFAEALVEYDWIIKNKPDLAIAYYFIATAHDNLGEYREALTAYENFMSRADSQTNQLEIEKVKLRLPRLKHQIQLGQGVKPKPSEKLQ